MAVASIRIMIDSYVVVSADRSKRESESRCVEMPSKEGSKQQRASTMQIREGSEFQRFPVA